LAERLVDPELIENGSAWERREIVVIKAIKEKNYCRRQKNNGRNRRSLPGGESLVFACVSIYGDGYFPSSRSSKIRYTRICLREVQLNTEFDEIK